MSNDMVMRDLQNIRGADSNSLLRMYDRANEVVIASLSQQERARADKAIQRIVKELEKRKVSFRNGHEKTAV
jgi:hypothetical protein